MRIAGGVRGAGSALGARRKRRLLDGACAVGQSPTRTYAQRPVTPAHHRRREILAGIAATLCLVAASLSAQAPPATKHSLTVEEAIAVRLVADPQLSPDGEWILFALTTTDLAANRRTTDSYLVGASGGVPRRFPGDTAHATEARWSPDGRRVAYIAGDQLWIADAAGTNRLRLTDLTGGARGPVWSPAGTRIAFTSAVTPSCDDDACNAAEARRRAASGGSVHVADALMYRHWDRWDDGTRLHLFVVAPDGGAPLELTPHAPYDVPPGPNGGTDGYAFSPDGREIAFTAKAPGRTEAWSTDLDVFVVPAMGGSPSAITAANAGADANPVYAPDGRWIVYRSQARAGFESDRWRLMAFDRGTKEAHELLPAWDRNADRYLFLADGKSLVLQSVDAARTKFFRVALTTGTDGRLVATAPATIVSERNNTAVAIDRAGRTIAWLRDAIDRPPEVYAAALSAGGISSVRAVTRANDSLLATVRLSPAEDLWFASVRGDSVQAMIVRPPQWVPGATYPVVLAIHGGPQSAWLDSWNTRWNAQLFAAPGYAVVLVNPRGSLGYGQRFTEAVTGDWGGAPYLDVMNGFDAALQRFPWLDSTRAAAVGGSYGGYLVDWIAGHSGRFRALVSHAGVFDLEAMYGATDELWLMDWEFGGPYWDPLAMATQYRTWSPHLYAKAFQTPTLVTAGELDYRVPYTESLSLFAALQRQGVASRLVVFADEGHWILKPSNQRRWWSEVTGWLGRWLGDGLTR
jgi:dipeptidyl aminopeptidase/acylaminoacyl peptidase